MSLPINKETWFTDNAQLIADSSQVVNKDHNLFVGRVEHLMGRLDKLCKIANIGTANFLW